MDMKSLEQEIKELLAKIDRPFTDNSASYDLPDFDVRLKSGQFTVEAKEKRQVIRTDLWPLGDIPEHHAFISDELTVRKLLSSAPASGMFVRDNTTGLYYFADIMTLLFMPRTRCEREMEPGKIKGKWVLDLRNFVCQDSLMGLFVSANLYLQELPLYTTKWSACYQQNFVGEKIVRAGMPRTQEMRNIDVEATR